MPNVWDLLGIERPLAAPAVSGPDDRSLTIVAPRRVEVPPPATPTLTARQMIEAAPEPPTGIGATIQRHIEDYAVPAGSAIGGITGTALGGGLSAGAAALPGATYGAALGGAAGRVLPEITRPFLTGEASKPADPLAAARTGAFEGAAQLVGGQAGRVVQRVLAPFASRVIPFARDVANPALERVSQRLSPAQMTESRVLDTLENIADASLLGGGRIEAMRTGVTQRGVQRLTDELTARVGNTMSPQEVVGLLSGSRKYGLAMGQAIKRAFYKNVDELAKDVFIDTQPIWNELRQGVGFRAQATLEKALSAASIDPERFFQIPVAGSGQIIPQTTFQLAQSARSRLLAVARRPAATAEDQAIRNTAGHLAGLIDQQMESATRRLNPEALRAFREANAFTAGVARRFDNRMVRRIFQQLENEPSRLDALLAMPNKADVLAQIERSVGTEAYKRLQERLATTVIHRAVDPSTGILSGRGLLESMKVLGNDTTAAIFGSNRAQVLQFARVVDFVQQRQTTGTGKIAIQLAQAPAAFQILRNPTGPLSGAAYAVLIGPAALARLLTSERGTSWLTTGLQRPEALAQGGRMARLLLGPLAVEPPRQALERKVAR